MPVYLRLGARQRNRGHQNHPGALHCIRNVPHDHIVVFGTQNTRSIQCCTMQYPLIFSTFECLFSDVMEDSRNPMRDDLRN